ncbi:MAG: NADH-quinone oxidoreductase subunit E [Acidimicrobiia bacterium]|nr:NADH-quinone oxidoreductase subunit E [Acidimicrobiia bacterium]
MDLKFHDVEPTPAERTAVDDAVGAPDSTWEGAEERSADDLRIARGGHAARAQRHLLLPALAAVQSEIGWISPGALDYICRRLQVPPADAYGVATFYALLSVEERPGCVAHVCDDIACRDSGGTAILEAFADRDDVVPSPCLGQCDRAPAAFIQRAGSPDLTLAPTAVSEITAALEGAVPEAELPNPTPQSDRSGMRVLERVGVVDPSSLEAFQASGGFSALEKSVEMGAAAVIAEVKASNLRGRGGAAFPTGVKWEGAAREDGPRYLICNADESEPGTFKDRVLMEGDPFGLIESMVIAGLAIGAEHGYIYVRGEYPVATSRLRSAIDQCEAAGWLGNDVNGTGRRFSVEIRRGQGAYICGEETALFNSIEGYRGEPRQKPPFPTQSGLFGKPTVVNNVETLLNIPGIVLGGGEAFAEIGTKDSTGTRLFCLSGSVAVPGVYEVPFGTTLRALLDMAGGAISDIKAILLGGAAGSFVGPDALDLALTFEDTRSAGVSLGSGVVMVFNETTSFVGTTRRIAEFFRDESCGQCVPCRVGTVRQEELLARHLNGADLDRSLLDDIAAVMADASICGLGHTAATAVRSAVDLGLLEAT